MTDDCRICRKHRGDPVPPGGPVYEDELVYASHAFDIFESGDLVFLGHLLVEPRRHVAGLAGLEDAEAERVGLLVSRLARALVEVRRAEHVYSAVVGHQTPHLHVHVWPRYPGTPRAYWFDDNYAWPGAPKGGPGEIASVTRELSASMSDWQLRSNI